MCLWPDLAASRVDLNDNVSHFGYIERIVHTVEHGGNPLDVWSPEWVCGFPVLRIYQPLAHMLVAAVYFLLFKSVSLMTVFCWVRFLAVLLLPVSFYFAARLMEFAVPAALAAAVASPMIVSAGLYGLEYGSYVWAGNGLFPQSVAAHLLLLSLGFGYRAVRTGRGFRLAGVLLGLTFIAHLIFGYMGAVSLILLAALPDAQTPHLARLVRTLQIGAVALALSLFQLLPLLIDGAIINHSHWEPTWKWDSFGASTVLGHVFLGRILDSGRAPVLSLAAFAGFVWVIRRWRTASLAERFAAAGTVLWILLFFGRPFWGPALTLFGISPDFQLHRVVAGAQVFLILLVGIAAGAAWSALVARRQILGAILLAAIALAPALVERSAYLADNAKWSRDNLAAYAGAAPALDAVIGRAREIGGRVYAGVPSGWGGLHKIGSVPFFGFLSTGQVPAIAFLYHAMSLPGDLQVRLNEWNPSHYRLFGIKSVVAPAGIQTALPPFWTSKETIARFDIFRTPETGYFDVVDAPLGVHVTKDNFFDVNDRWRLGGQACPPVARSRRPGAGRDAHLARRGAAADTCDVAGRIDRIGARCRSGVSRRVRCGATGLRTVQDDVASELARDGGWPRGYYGDALARIYRSAGGTGAAFDRSAVRRQRVEVVAGDRRRDCRGRGATAGGCARARHGGALAPGSPGRSGCLDRAAGGGADADIAATGRRRCTRVFAAAGRVPPQCGTGNSAATMGARFRSRRGPADAAIRSADAALRRRGAARIRSRSAGLGQYRVRAAGDSLCGGNVPAGAALLRNARRPVRRGGCGVRALYVARSLRAQRAERVLGISVLCVRVVWIRRVRAQRTTTPSAVGRRGLRRCGDESLPGCVLLHAAAGCLHPVHLAARDVEMAGCGIAAWSCAERVRVAADSRRRPLCAARARHAG